MAIKDVKKFPIGGVHLPEKKDLTNEQQIKVMPAPKKVAIPLAQHIGAPAEPIVEVGDEVKKGDCIAKLQGKISANVHSSVNGVVQGIVERTKPGQGTYNCILIESLDIEAFEEENKNVDRSILPEVETIRKKVKAAGVIGMGGAGFPTHVKLSPPDDIKIDTVIINGAECEPFLTVDHRLLLEEYEDLFRGLELIKKAVGAEKGIVAIELNKKDAIEKLQEKAKDWPGIDVQALDTRYPHGAEKHLIKAVLNREVPKGELPMAVNVVVNNVQTAVKIARAVDFDEPVTDRVLTVSGEALKRPSNVKVPIGSSIKDVVDFCGGPKDKEDYQIIVGGPMTGINVDDENIPVVKLTSGIVLITAEEFADSETRPCIRCGRCGEVCPMYLAPNRICAFINNDLIERSEEIGLMDCIECGACAYICPSKRPLVRWIKRGKAEVKANDN
jgi:electron transport complex protein RnfC